MNPWISIPVTLALVYRAYSRNSLTPLGIVFATLTAIAHAIHPWSAFFALLVVFFLAGTAITKIKHKVKSRLTISSSGAPGGEAPRNHIQVLANSVVASILILIHAWQLGKGDQCFRNNARGRPADIIVSGIVANYAAVAADTFSSELGILSPKAPRLITAPWRIVPRGTNGGVTASGIKAGLSGGFILSATAGLLMPFCDEADEKRLGVTGIAWTLRSKTNFVMLLTFIGVAGSLLDSLLGALLQASVVDVRTGKVIEGDGGKKVLVHGDSRFSEPTEKVDVSTPRRRKKGKAATAGKDESSGDSRKIAVGRDILSNNGVNLLMAATMSTFAILGTATVWQVDIERLIRQLI